MKKRLLLGLGAAALLSLTSMSAFAEGALKTNDGLLEIELPEGNWYQIISEENTEMFSDGNCAILVNLYKNGETLPAIESADANHELIYTAAASTQDYILHVVGYANHQSDFSGICKAINSIKVDNTKITDSMLNHSLSIEKYAIAEMNYTAWVAVDELNVRSTSEDGSIITTLASGDKVTVTGSVLKNSVEIGWSRIKTADGTEGYVSSQFLSVIATGTTDTAPEANKEAEKTSATVVLYDGSDPYTLYVYTDGSLRTDDGQIYWQSSIGVYTDYNGSTLYAGPTGPRTSGIYRTGNVRTVYTIDGVPYTIYEYSDGLYYDDSMNYYTESRGCDYMTANGGEWLVYSGDPTITYSGPTTFVSFILVDDYGQSVEISKLDEATGTYYDTNGYAYYRYNAFGAYIDQFDIMYYDPSYVDYHSVPVEYDNGFNTDETLLYHIDSEGGYLDGGGMIMIHEEDGIWVDGDGNQMVGEDDGVWYRLSDGSRWR